MHSGFIIIVLFVTTLLFLTFTALLLYGFNWERERTFEICDESFPFRRFITVLDKYQHHYTRETMRHIRIELKGSVGAGGSIVYYETVDEDRWNQLRKRRVKEKKNG